MRPPAPAACSAIILAGGRGSRMGGRDKAGLKWRNRTVLQHLCRQLRTQVSEIIVVRSRVRQAMRCPAGVRRAHDDQAYAGPVGGLLAGLKRSRKAWCLCVPVDGLNPPPQLKQQLARRSRQGGYVAHAGNQYYLHQLLPRRHHKTLQAFHQGGGRSAANACRSLQLQAVPMADNGAVWSINTQGEYRRLQRQRRLLGRC